MERDLEGKVSVVTGGTRGIGRAISLGLAGRGSNVVMAYFRNGDAARATLADVEGLGVKAQIVKCQVGDEAQIASLFDQVGETFGRVDVFVSNAATGVNRPLEAIDAHRWDWTMNANARALLLGAQRAKALMVDGGSIVALTSEGARRVLPGYGTVGVSKAAIEALVRYLGVEWAPDGIRVNAVSPGVVATDALKHFEHGREMVDVALAKTPAGRLATPDDVADLVNFLTSERATMITGQTIVIDGAAGLVP